MTRIIALVLGFGLTAGCYVRASAPGVGVELGPPLFAPAYRRPEVVYPAPSYYGPSWSYGPSYAPYYGYRGGWRRGWR